MEKITTKRFAELAKCGCNLISYYVKQKGMPKHDVPGQKGYLLDLKECYEWARKNGYKSFRKKIEKALSAYSRKNSVKIPLNESGGPIDPDQLTEAMKEKHEGKPTETSESEEEAWKQEYCTEPVDEESTAPDEPVMEVDMINELDRRYDSFRSYLEICLEKVNK